MVMRMSMSGALRGAAPAAGRRRRGEPRGCAGGAARGRPIAAAAAVRGAGPGAPRSSAELSAKFFRREGGAGAAEPARRRGGMLGQRGAASPAGQRCAAGTCERGCERRLGRRSRAASGPCAGI